MSTIRPEFYDFIKKLEENDDKLGSDWNLENNLEFEYNNSTCHVCNGYYGPSFGEPVCVTCHAFLFPDFPSYLPSSYYISEKTDDGDSGNDEPSDLTYMNADRKTNRAALPPWLWNQSSMENEVSPEEVEVFGAPSFAWVGASSEGEGIWPVRPPPPPPPSLARNLQALSLPRPPDNLAPGLVEQLPAEGSGLKLSMLVQNRLERSHNRYHRFLVNDGNRLLNMLSKTHMLLCIFSYLDDLSLAACACVCARWRRLVRAQVPPTRWAHYVAHRWPLFRPIVLLPTFDWQKMYQTLVDACFCRMCLLQMCTQAQPVGEASHWRRNRLRSELKMMRTDPAEGIAAIPLDTKCCHWQASVAGPVGSPYEGGIFYLYIQVPYTYPLSPPVVRFLTRIIHPNVSRHGDVGIDSVQHNWSIAFTISKVLISIQSLLTDPYTAVCMEPEVGALYRESRARFERAARQWTWRYAMLDVIPPLAAASRPPPAPAAPNAAHMTV